MLWAVRLRVLTCALSFTRWRATAELTIVNVFADVRLSAAQVRTTHIGLPAVAHRNLPLHRDSHGTKPAGARTLFCVAAPRRTIAQHR